MAHVTTPRWQSPVSRRILFIIVAAAAALMLLTSILVTSASAAGPERVRNVKEPACQELGFGVDTFKETVPRGDADPNYDEVVPLSGRSDVDLLGSVRLTAPPNRSFVTFTLDEAAVKAGVIVLGAVLFNRTDQKDGNLYDYRDDGVVTEGTLEPPPRDQGNEKQVVICFGLVNLVKCGESITTGGPGLDDKPRAAFWAGPSKLYDPCPAVPISLVADVIGDNQIVRVEPPAGLVWDGVTGLVTIQWDAVTATGDGEVPRTKQVVGTTESVIPWCNEVVGITRVTDPLVTDKWFYVLGDESALYPTATSEGETSEGDICLVLQSTTPVAPGRVQTTEVFYIWNDPILIRPR